MQRLKNSAAAVFSGIVLVAASLQVQALTTWEFLQLCDDTAGACAEQPVVQLYLGGAMDALAVVNETALQKRPLYCLPERQLFDMHRIFAHIAENQQRFRQRNVMHAMLDYLRLHGGCGGAG